MVLGNLHIEFEKSIKELDNYTISYTESILPKLKILMWNANLDILEDNTMGKLCDIGTCTIFYTEHISNNYMGF